MSVPSKYLILMTLALIANFNLMLSLRDSFAVPRDYNFVIPTSQNIAVTAECRETTSNHSSVLQTELLIVRNESLQLKQLLKQRTEELQQLQKRYRQVANDLRKSQGRTQIAKIALPINLVEDSFLFGKSCQRIGTEWVCRDCRGDETLWEACSLLQPHSPCSPWDFGGLDDPRPRLVTRHDDHATTDGLRFVMERMGYRGAYEQFPCLELQDCFNLTRCENTREALQVYIYGEYGDPITRKLANELSGIVQITNSSDACLLVVTPRTLRGQKDGYTQLVQQESWMEGRNHFMFRSHWILNYEFDRFVGKDHFHRAALSGPNFYQGVFRVGYDVSLYYDHPQHPFVVNDTIYNLVQSQIHRSRPYLLTFQGTIKKILPWFSHRWLASAYWPRDDPQVFANVRCPADNVTMKQQVDYVSALTSSTFVFCPGGRSPGSWRWGEALALGKSLMHDCSWTRTQGFDIILQIIDMFQVPYLSSRATLFLLSIQKWIGEAVLLQLMKGESLIYPEYYEKSLLKRFGVDKRGATAYSRVL